MMSHSLAVTAQTDSMGNAIASGFQGAISVQQPASSPSVVESWHSLALNGTNASASGNGVNGFFYRFTGENEVELLWDIKLLTTSGTVTTLPVGYQPDLDVNMPSGWYGTGPSVYTAGFAPHWLIRGRRNTVRGQIVMEGFTVANMYMFGRDKFSLDVGVLWVSL